MAEWKRTSEPYIKVHETVKTTTINPTAGEDLIVGVTFISDAGPSTPILINGQDEFLANYASQEVSKEYIESLNNFYSGDDKGLASALWANAYRLAGSTSLLCVRATKAGGMYYSRPLSGEYKNNSFILRDGELLRKVPEFKLVIDTQGDSAEHASDGWTINIRNVGKFGNRTTDEGPQYDYLVRNLPDLVKELNATSKFFSPNYSFYTNPEGTSEWEESDDEESRESVVSVVFEDVYVAENLLETEGEPEGTPEPSKGLKYIISCERDWTPANPNQKLIALNSSAFSGFIPSDWYATNIYNTTSELRVRIRRFNHDAVVAKSIDEQYELTENGLSPWTVLDKVLDTYTAGGTKEPSASVLARDFYEVAVYDPSQSDIVNFFNLGNVPGRGDITADELSDLLGMIGITLPENLRELGLEYYSYKDGVRHWKETDDPGYEKVSSYAALLDLVDVPVGQICYAAEENMVYRYTATVANGDVEWLEYRNVNGVDELPTLETEEVWYVRDNSKYYKNPTNGDQQNFVDLSVDASRDGALLMVSDADLMNALESISENEIYTVEGLCDLGNTYLPFQTRLVGMAVNENYFYPISTVNSTNYMVIGNGATKIPQESYKLYMHTPWDIDTATLGWKFFAAPSTLYWEGVSANRRAGQEFIGLFGQTGGRVPYQNPTVEFNKKSRELLLSKRVNSVIWDTATQTWVMNDNYTKQSVDNIMADDGNSRLGIRISKAIPTLLKQYIGKKISEKLCENVENTLDYFFKTVIMPLDPGPEAYRIRCEYDPDLARKNKIKVVVNVRFYRSLKFVEVYNNFFDVGMDIDNFS